MQVGAAYCCSGAVSPRRQYAGMPLQSEHTSCCHFYDHIVRVLDLWDFHLFDADAEGAFVMHCFHGLRVCSHCCNNNMEKCLCNGKALAVGQHNAINHLFTLRP